MREKSGAKSIEEIEPGDYVWSRDPDTGQEAWREVTETTICHDIPVLRLETEATDGSTDALTTTGEHPFWVNGQGWTPAGKLEPGDEVFSAAGGWLKVTSTTWLQDTRTVYNQLRPIRCVTSSGVERPPSPSVRVECARITNPNGGKRWRNSRLRSTMS